MNPKDIDIQSFDYSLPDSLIARHPLPQRDACRLLVRDASGIISDRRFTDLPDLLPSGTILVCNNTRVINARLKFVKPSGAVIEIFCLEPHLPADYALSFAASPSCSWTCLVGNSKRWKDGDLTMPVTLPDGSSLTLSASRIDRSDSGSVICFSWDNPAVSFSEIIAASGQIPIPPYLNRQSEQSDLTDYQTVFSRIEGSVAAPTAGLHFTDAVLDRIDRRGILRSEVTLHVGAGTFRPVKADRIGEHEMHSEFISVPVSFIRRLAGNALSAPRKVFAVGTTSVRTLESLYHIGCMVARGTWDGELPQWYPYSPSHPGLSVADALTALADDLDARSLDALHADTRIIIAPGYTYRLVEGMITNFHQPRSTLLLLVSAFIGDSWRDVYDHATASGYRFLSYGDACLFLR